MKKYNGRRKNNRFTFVLIGIIFLVFIFLGMFFYNKYGDNLSVKNEENIVKEISSHYSENVTTTRDSLIYTLEEGKYVESGMVYKDAILGLDSININKDTEYFLINSLDDKYYIKYDDVTPSDKKDEINDRYKNYIPFNESVVGKNVNLYKNDNLVLTLNKDVSLPIYIKDNDMYYVEYAGDLYGVKKDSVVITANSNTDKKNISKIGVLNYHFFWDDETEKNSDCNQEICHSKTQFKKHLDYIKDNNILTLKMDELEKWIDGKLQLPKSVVITIDDGWRIDLGIQMLEEYKLNGTVFLISSWFDDVSFINDYNYVEFHSHGENLHTVGVCPGGQGGGIKCLPEDKLLDDLKTSRKKLNNTTFFCYPFYEFNDYSISVLKKAGFTMAFAGESSYKDNHVTIGSDKYRLPRFVVVTYTTMKDFTDFVG